MEKEFGQTGVARELLVVDDESAGSEKTEEIVNKLKNESFPIRIHRRYKKEGRGLSSAVMLGFEKAKFNCLVCMDSDLQHEPESVPAVVKPIIDGTAEFTVGCRYMDDEKAGIAFEWNVVRQIMSTVATLMAWGVTTSKDPMSGFFSLRQSTLSRAKDDVNKIGFKIGLEIMARCKCDPVQDVPIMFQERLHGESKLSGKQMYEYLFQLVELYWARYKFLIVTAVVAVLSVLGYLVKQLL